MITKTVGLLRKVVKRRKELKVMFRNIIHSDECIAICLNENALSVGGYTEDDAHALFMLGRAIGQCVENHVQNNPEADISNALMQPNIVATTYLTSKGVM